MKHCETQRIETERLLLRPFFIDDAQAMYQNGDSDPEAVKYLMWPVHSDINVSKAVLEEVKSKIVCKLPLGMEP